MGLFSGKGSTPESKAFGKSTQIKNKRNKSDGQRNVKSKAKPGPPPGKTARSWWN